MMNGKTVAIWPWLAVLALAIGGASGCKKKDSPASKCRNGTSYGESDKNEKLANCLAACGEGEKWACDMAETLKGKARENSAAAKCKDLPSWHESDKNEKLANCLAACGEGEKWACDMANVLKPGVAPGSSAAAATLPTEWATFKIAGTWSYKRSKDKPLKDEPKGIKNSKVTFNDDGTVEVATPDIIYACSGWHAREYYELKPSGSRLLYHHYDQSPAKRDADDSGNPVGMVYVSPDEFKLVRGPTQECILTRDK
jgi:hypothetical protein